MLRSVFAPVTVEQFASGISLSNGIVERRFFVRHPSRAILLVLLRKRRRVLRLIFQISGGAFCTVEYQLLLSQTTFFRGLSPESNLTLDGRAYNVGGCQGVGPDHFEFWNPEVYLGNLSADANAFQYISHAVSPPVEPFKWKPGTRYSPPTVVWPPAGIHLSVNFGPPASAPPEHQHVTVTVNYEMYVGLPALRKWVSVSVSDSTSHTVDTMAIELLRAPNFAPQKLTILNVQANNPTPFEQQTVPDPQSSFPGRDQQLWFFDPNYDQCCDRELHVPYTLYTFLVVGYGYNTVYGNRTGPGALVSSATAFTSVSVYEVLHDTMDLERQGLAIRRFNRVVTPQLLEAPIPFMITDISTTGAFRHAIDQASATGVEIVRHAMRHAACCMPHAA